ncbi:hypothetical protein [Mesorhizobium sp. DCY119]|uniref:hypothetical protein n=1 Tax=Mesorhizobium sp. DCY119 TaxID=2108445 RepID=UPI000E6D192B|nr:hypothetical protein [Mesorhizobium sp. DCY119]RJG42895.1 hypothetical protein D3Y55_00470 [Mesorhizobium sp. DCY119]
MGLKQASTGWFAALRRDRRLFALAATLVLVAHVFQPLAEARAANTANAWIICTTFGMQTATPDGKQLPPIGAADDCPTCIGGPCAGMAAPLKIEPSFEAAFPALVESRGQLFASFEAKIPPDRLNEPPPAIRAPPSILA